MRTNTVNKFLKNQIIVFLLAALTVIFYLFAFFVAKKETIFADGAGYFSYPYQIFEEGNLSYSSANAKNTFGVYQLENGNYLNKYALGTGILLTPAYLIGSLFESNTNTLFDSRFQFFVGINGIFYFFLGMVILNKLLGKFFKRRVVDLTLVVITLTTNLLIYASTDASFSHIYSFFAVTLFIYLSVIWNSKPTVKYSVLLGLSLGLVVLIRQVNVIVLLFFIIFNFKLIKNNINKLLIIPLICLLIIFPQLLYWHSQTGSFLFFAYANESFNLLKPDFLTVLIHKERGLLTHSILLISILGGFFTLKKIRVRLLLASLTVITLVFYTISSWWFPDFGIGFGHRGFTDFLSLFAILLALTIESVQLSKSKWIKYFFIILLSLTFILNIQRVLIYIGT